MASKVWRVSSESSVECKMQSAECTVQGKIQRSTVGTGVDLGKRGKK